RGGRRRAAPARRAHRAARRGRRDLGNRGVPAGAGGAADALSGHSRQARSGQRRSIRRDQREEARLERAGHLGPALPHRAPARPADPDLTRGPRPVGFPFVMRPVIVAALLLALVQVSWAEVLGGGLANTDCRLVFRGVSATNANSGVVCTDGDPSCDADGVADGACHFAVRLCTGTATSGCDTATFSSISVAGLHVPPPHVPAPDGTCGPTTDLEVPVGMPSGTTVLGRDGNELRDVDYLQLCC